MIFKVINNRLYFFSIGLLYALTYLLNTATAIYQCALIFTLIAVTTNLLTSLYGKTKALTALSIAIIISFAQQWQLPYYIDGKIVNGLVTASFSSIIVSMYWSASIFQILNHKFTVNVSTALSLILAAIIDGLIMGLFFIINNNFSYERILDIFTREVSYKTLYGIITSMVISIAVDILKNNHKQKMNNYYL